MGWGFAVAAGLARQGSGENPRDKYQTAIENSLGPSVHSILALQLTIMLAYANGRGVPRDYRKASKWFRKGFQDVPGRYRRPESFLDTVSILVRLFNLAPVSMA